MKNTPRIIEFPRIYDPRGNLTFAENGDGLVPFDIRRAYWIYDVPAGEERGSHAHKQFQEIIVAVAGSFTVHLHDGEQWHEYNLNRPFQGLYVPPGYWRKLDNFSSGSVCLVLVSEKYSEDDYIRSWDEFLDSKSK